MGSKEGGTGLQGIWEDAHGLRDNYHVINLFGREIDTHDRQSSTKGGSRCWLRFLAALQHITTFNRQFKDNIAAC